MTTAWVQQKTSLSSMVIIHVASRLLLSVISLLIGNEDPALNSVSKSVPDLGWGEPHRLCEVVLPKASLEYMGFSVRAAVSHTRIEGSVFSDPCLITTINNWYILLEYFKLLSWYMLINIYLILIHPFIHLFKKCLLNYFYVWEIEIRPQESEEKKRSSQRNSLSIQKTLINFCRQRGTGALSLGWARCARNLDGFVNKLSLTYRLW